MARLIAGLLTLFLASGAVVAPPPPDMPPEEVFRLAAAYADHGTLGPAVAWLSALVQDAPAPELRGRAALRCLTVLQTAQREGEAWDLAERFLEADLPGEVRAAIHLRRAALAIQAGRGDEAESDLIAAWRLGSLEVREEAAFRLILRWGELGRVQEEAARLERSEDPVDHLLLGHMRWSTLHDREGAAREYERWLERGEWSLRVAERLEAYYRLAGEQDLLEALLRTRWARADGRSERDRTARDLLALYRERGMLDDRVQIWAAGLDRGNGRDADLYLLALHRQEAGDRAGTVEAWRALEGLRPGLPEAVEALVPWDLAQDRWPQALALLDRLGASTPVARAEGVRLLMAAVQQAGLEQAAMVARLMALTAEFRDNEFLLRFLAQLLWDARDPAAGPLYLLLAERFPQEEEPLLRATDVARVAGDRSSLKALLGFQVERLPERAPGSCLQLAGMALDDGDSGQVLRWARRAVELAPEEPLRVRVRVSAAHLVESAGSPGLAREFLTEAALAAREFEDRATVLADLAQLHLRHGRIQDAARLARAAVCYTGRSGDTLETLQGLMARAAAGLGRISDTAHLALAGPPARELLEPAAVDLDLYYSPETPDLEAVLQAVERVRQTLGQAVRVRLHDIYDPAAFQRMLRTETEGGVQAARPLLLRAGVTEFSGAELAVEALEKLAAGAVDPWDLAYLPGDKGGGREQSGGLAPGSAVPAEGPPVSRSDRGPAPPPASAPPGGPAEPEPPAPGQGRVSLALALALALGLAMGYVIFGTHRPVRS